MAKPHARLSPFWATMLAHPTMALPTLQPGLVPMATFEDMDVAAALLALQRGLAPAVTAPHSAHDPLGAHDNSQWFAWRSL